MKITIVILVLISSTLSNAQMQLDTSKLALFGNEKISTALILQADSLLNSAVDYYNKRVSRGYYLVSLNESQYLEYLKLDSLNHEIDPFLTKNGRTKKRLLKKLPKEEKDKIAELIMKKDIIRDSIDYLEVVGKPNNDDTLVSSWGDAGFIDIQNYYRQYQYWFDKDGNCKIRASCLCSDMIEMINRTPKEKRLNWKTMLLTVHHGGSCFFTIVLELNENKASRMRVNGM